VQHQLYVYARRVIKRRANDYSLRELGKQSARNSHNRTAFAYSSLLLINIKTRV
jgi:hypothetical protein